MVEALRGQRDIGRCRRLRSLIRCSGGLGRTEIGAALLACLVIGLVESTALDALNCGDTGCWSEAHDVSLEYDRTIEKPALREMAGSGDGAPAQRGIEAFRPLRTYCSGT